MIKSLQETYSNQHLPLYGDICIFTDHYISLESLLLTSLLTLSRMPSVSRIDREAHAITLAHRKIKGNNKINVFAKACTTENLVQIILEAEIAL